uniref:Prolyl endopeptidase n=1 Tax=Strongyloides papillosus TaxID=174720 RepID=A0A0N5CCI0_STREA
MYFKFLIFYIIALVAFLPYLYTDAKKSKSTNKDGENGLAEVSGSDNSNEIAEYKEEKGSKRGKKGKHIVKHEGHTDIHIHIHHHKLPPHCKPIKPRPPRPEKTTTHGPRTTTRRGKPQRTTKPSSGGKTTTIIPTTTIKTKRTKKPKTTPKGTTPKPSKPDDKPPKPSKPSKPSTKTPAKPQATTKPPTDIKTTKPPKTNKPPKPSKPEDEPPKTTKPPKTNKPPKPSRPEDEPPKTTKPPKTNKPPKPSKPEDKPPKTTKPPHKPPHGPPVEPPVKPPHKPPHEPPVKPPHKPTPRPPSNGKPTTPRKTKRPPKTTTPSRNECDDWRDYYYERYHSTIKINVTEYVQAERCKNKCSETISEKEVYDYYRDLESLKNQKTLKFVKQLNKISYKYLSSITIRNYIERKITSFSSYTKLGIFEKRSQYVYYRYREAFKDRDSIWRRDGYLGTGKVFLDIDKIDSTGQQMITHYSFSKDNKYMAYTLCVKGNFLCTIKFKETDKTYKKIKDELKYVYIRLMGFAYGGKGFFYSAYATKEGVIVSSLNTTKDIYHTLFYHRFGTDQKKDILIDADYENPNVYVDGWVSPDERMLFVKYSLGDNEALNSIKFLRLYKLSESSIKKGIKLQPLFTKYDALYTIVDSSYDEAILLTTKNAPNGRVVKINIRNAGKSEKNWKVLIKGDKNKLFKNVTAVGQKYLFVNYMENVTNKAFLYDKRNGKMLTQLDFETSYSVEFSGSIYNSRFFIKVMNQAVPQIIYTGNTLDLKYIKKRQFKLRVVERTEISGIERDDYVIKTIYYPSFDRTMIPIFMFHRKGIKLDGQNPLLLESYGAFGYSFFPTYSPSNLMFVTHFNGIYAIAAVRGGGEYGEAWHKAGSVENKNNTFNDFISAAEFLINTKYTRPAKLAIRGVEDGGLLAAVVSRYRPDLFGSVIMDSPLTDMVRYLKLNFAITWLAEFGNPNRKGLDYLLKYSPYHNIKMPMRPVQWPCTLISTPLDEKNVHAAHTLKYVAELYHVIRQDGIKYQRNPVLVTVNEEEKHTTIVTEKQVIKKRVNEFSFVKETLNIKWRYSS